MATQDSKTANGLWCDKCGSEMIKRVITVRENNTVKHKSILQCIVCRHWISI